MNAFTICTWTMGSMHADTFGDSKYLNIAPSKFGGPRPRGLRKCYGSINDLRATQRSKETLTLTDENKRYFYSVKNVIYHYLSDSETLEKFLMDNNRYPTREELENQLRTVDRRIKYSKKYTYIKCLDERFHTDLKDVVLVQYYGQEPKTAPRPHLNARTCTRPFIPTNRAELEEARSLVIDEKMRVAEAMLKINEGKDETEGIRDSAVLHRIKHEHRKKLGQIKHDNPSLYDETIQLVKKFYDKENTFLQRLDLVSKTEVPVAICYRESTMSMVRSIIRGHPNVVIGVDRTFNLSTCFLTAATIQIPNLKNARTEDGESSPVIGFMFMLHYFSKKEHYSKLIQALKDELYKDKKFKGNVTFKATELDEDEDEIDARKILLGSDQEYALRNAIAEIFPEAEHIFCLLHLKKNLEHSLKGHKDKSKILNLIFNERHGIMNCDSLDEYDAKLEDLKEEYAEDEKALRHINKTGALLRDRLVTPHVKYNSSLRFTNNATESFNFILKNLLNWDPRNMIPLLIFLEKVAIDQERNIRCALLGTGKFKLKRDLCKKHRQKIGNWLAMSKPQRDKKIAEMLQHNSKDSKVTTITHDGKVIEMKTVGKIAKKPGGQSSKKQKSETRTKKMYPRKKNRLRKKAMTFLNHLKMCFH